MLNLKRILREANRSSRDISIVRDLEDIDDSVDWQGYVTNFSPTDEGERFPPGSNAPGALGNIQKAQDVEVEDLNMATSDMDDVEWQDVMINGDLIVAEGQTMTGHSSMSYRGPGYEEEGDASVTLTIGRKDGAVPSNEELEYVKEKLQVK